jgi:predicted nucleic acid-binding Zn ribbon protein
MGAGSGPRHLSGALSELIALRGLARVQGDSQLAAVWQDVAGSAIAAQTRPLGIRRGVLLIGVANAPLLSELAAFHKEELLEEFRKNHADLKIRGLKFRLRGDLAYPGAK